MATYQVYRNLNKQGFFSVKHKGIVIDYAEAMIMEGCVFHVNETGRQRVCTQRRKWVHAYIKGENYTKEVGTVNLSDYEEVWYSPYFTKSFMGLVSGKEYENAEKVLFLNNKCYCKI